MPNAEQRRARGVGSKAMLRLSVVFATMVAVPACNPGGDDSGNPAVYVGSWAYEDESTQSTCPAGDVTTGLSYPGGSLVVAVAASGLTATDRDGCNATFTIDGSTATAQSGQTCTTANAETLTIDSWTIFVYDAQHLWNERRIGRTSSAGSTCSVSTVATVVQ
jgi:hypothetical protein